MSSAPNQPEATAAEIQQWTDELANPRTRRAARQRLVRARAVDPLIDCLDAINEAVVWSAVESLGELRAREAVPKLLELLERGVLTLDVIEALTRITRQEYGGNVAAWRRWLAEFDPAAVPELDIEELITRTSSLLGVEPSPSGSSYWFPLSLDEGRAQKVAVYFGREDAEGEELVVIYSECGPADPKYYEVVLRKNLSIPSGAFAVRDLDGSPHFVLVDTMLASSATPSALAKKIEHIADRADAVEQSLTKQDTR
jgi:hypothetical protein